MLQKSSIFLSNTSKVIKMNCNMRKRGCCSWNISLYYTSNILHYPERVRSSLGPIIEVLLYLKQKTITKLSLLLLMLFVSNVTIKLSFLRVRLISLKKGYIRSKDQKWFKKSGHWTFFELCNSSNQISRILSRLASWY